MFHAQEKLCPTYSYDEQQQRKKIGEKKSRCSHHFNFGCIPQMPPSISVHSVNISHSSFGSEAISANSNSTSRANRPYCKDENDDKLLVTSSYKNIKTQIRKSRCKVPNQKARMLMFDAQIIVKKFSKTKHKLKVQTKDWC